MKTTPIQYIVLIATILWYSASGSAQNLVQNGGFEEFASCPIGIGDLSCVEWFSALNSPDYYNSCSQTAGVPDNPISYQESFDGQGYVGFHTYFLNDADYREVIGVKLTESLIIGTVYYFSFRINKADKTENIKATNNVGIKFSVDSIQTESALINNIAHFKIDSICYDSVNWSLITGSITADAEYKYLYIGNFFNDENTQTDGPGTVWDRNGYYNLEDVRLSIDQNYAWSTVGDAIRHQQPTVLFNSSNSSLQFYNIVSSLEVDVYSISGGLVGSYNISDESDSINTGNLPAGIFLAILRDERRNNYTYKFLVN
jgi:hypothetical protein